MEDNANKKHSVFELAKKYWAVAKQIMPRSMLLFFIFIVLAGFFSSVFTAIAISILSALATKAGMSAFATLIFFGIEFLFLVCALLTFYGVVLCNLRFVRNQPVALNFLFVGFRQRRAKTMAAFFAAILVAVFFLTIIPAMGKLAAGLPQFTELQSLVDYLSENPEIMERFAVQTLIFVIVTIVLFLPFIFTPSFVYDADKNTFRETLGASVKFFGKNFFRFLGFEIAVNFIIAAIMALMYIAQTFIVRLGGNSSPMLLLSSVIAVVKFFCSMVFYSNIILSANFYYDAIHFDKIETTTETAPDTTPLIDLQVSDTPSPDTKTSDNAPTADSTTNKNENPQSDRKN